MHLTEHEKQEIKALIDAGQPLPARYRHLLFADPLEAELVWPGKTAEITNAILPFQSIEQIDEPRAETPTGGGGKRLSFFQPTRADGKAADGATSSSGATTSWSSRRSPMAHCARRSSALAD